MSKLQLSHFDYDRNETVNDGEISIRKIAKSLDPQTFAELLDDYANCYTGGYKRGHETGEALQRSHRTLQRSVIVELVGVIAGLSEQDYTDPRNEHAIELAKKIKELYEEHGAGMMI